MLEELKAAFRPYGYMLTAAVSPGKNTIDAAYDIPELSRLLDHIHVILLFPLEWYLYIGYSFIIIRWWATITTVPGILTPATTPHSSPILLSTRAKKPISAKYDHTIFKF